MTRDMDAIVERAAELFHEHRRGHYGFKPWADADAAQRNMARGTMLRTAKHALAAADELGPRQINTVEELAALPRNSIVAVLTHSRNVPISVVFQRGSNSEGGAGWCTPEAMGQITSEQVFEFIGLNCLPYEFTVLYEPRP